MIGVEDATQGQKKVAKFEMKGYRRDPKMFAKLVPVISEALAKFPNMRLGQLLVNVHFSMGKGLDTFATTDEEFLEGFQNFIKGKVEPEDNP